MIIYIWWVASVLLLSRLYLSLSFNSLFIICLGVDLFKFILLGVWWASWMFMFMSFTKFGKFWIIISSNYVSASYYLSSFRISTVCILAFLMVSHRSLGLSSLFFIFFPFLWLRLNNSICPILTSVDFPCPPPPPGQISLCVPLVNFSFELLYSLNTFSLASFSVFYSFIGISILFVHSFLAFFCFCCCWVPLR